MSVEAASTNVPSDYPTAIDNFYLNTAYSTGVSQTSVNVSYRNVLAVNFDMSAEDAPYTVADYAAGKSVPLTLRKEAGIYSTDPDMGAGTSSGWAINNPSGSGITTRGDWRCFSAVYYAYNRTSDLPDGVAYAIDLSTKPKSSSTGDAYLANMGLGNLSSLSGKAVKGTLSFWYKKNNTDSSSYLGAMISKSVLGEITGAEVGDTNWHYFEADVETELTGTSGFYLGVYSYAASGTFTDYPWSIADFTLTIQSISSVTAATDENGNPYKTSYSISVDVPKNTYWTDCEFKVLDASKNLVYWVSTQRGAQFQGSDYATNPATDLNAKIYYTLADTHDPKNRNWVLFEYNSTDARSIYEHAQKVSGNPTPTIGGIVIQPNFKGTTVGGTQISTLFGTVQGDAPQGYSYVICRASLTSLEKTAGGDCIWRPVKPVSILKEY